MAPGIGDTGGCLGRHLLEGNGPTALSPSKKYIKIISIHLFYQLPSESQQVAGSSKLHTVKAGLHPGQAATSLQSHIETHTISQFTVSIHLTCMFFRLIFNKD